MSYGSIISDDDAAHAVVYRLLDALPPGSWLALTQLTGDLLPDDVLAKFPAINADAGIPMHIRNRDETTRFFTGLDLAAPGIVAVNRWRADTEPGVRPGDHETAVYAGLGRKPGQGRGGDAT